MSVQELENAQLEAQAKLEEAVKQFEAERTTADVAVIVKLGNAVTSATRILERASTELANFELVGIYEAVKAQVLKLGDKVLAADSIKTLQSKNVSSVTIVVPLTADAIEAERVSVNTLGKRTRVASTGGGNGARAKWHMVNDASGETMECREFLETHGDAALGTDAKVTAAMVLEAPARYGLGDYAARAGRKLEPSWSRVQKDA
jgi:hypothetical protein